MPQPPAPDPDAGSLVRSERRAVRDVLGASVLFAACNVAWRYGAGPTVVVVFARVAIGGALVWAVGRWRGLPSWRQAVTTPVGLVAVLTSGATMVVAGTMFRTIDGPLAGMAIACTPAVAMLVRDRVGGRAAVAAVGSSVAAVVGIAHAASDAGSVSHVGAGAAALAIGFVALEVLSMRSCQIAVEGGIDATAIVTGSMIAAAVATLPFAVAAEVGAGTSTLVAATLAALTVAVLGTLGRVMRTVALPAAGVPAVAASTQVTALGTALGGMILFGDVVGVVGAVCALLAAGLGVMAVVAGTQWRLARDAALAAPLELRPEPLVD